MSAELRAQLAMRVEGAGELGLAPAALGAHDEDRGAALGGGPAFDAAHEGERGAQRFQARRSPLVQPVNERSRSARGLARELVLAALAFGAVALGEERRGRQAHASERELADHVAALAAAERYMMWSASRSQRGAVRAVLRRAAHARELAPHRRHGVRARAGRKPKRW
jgi:hypothetical protein